MNCTILEISTKILRLFVPKLNALVVPLKFNRPLFLITLNPKQRDKRAYTDFALRIKLAKKMAFCG